MTRFNPGGDAQETLGEIVVGLDEVEALRLADLQGLAQGQVAAEMGVSRQTVGRVLARARAKVAGALIQGRGLRIEGGAVDIATAQKGKIMRVAIALDEAGKVARHFGKSASFSIVELKDGQTVSEQQRENPRQGRQHRNRDQAGAQGAHTHGRGHGHGHGHGCGQGEQHRHGQAHGCGPGHGGGWIARTLGDCDAVITAGMGAGAVSRLKAQGIRPIVLDQELEPDQALELFTKGRI